ncbi:uncharacterized protein LOC134855470 isoform X1 [Symsagittifera roscoffensis]|uniref:uncharacterized protein LOC134855470 isoform X1 n=1 Tax=Symsagittifera roscoffensis TaxID=84072 RepID=UPI00307B2714
MLRSFKNCMTFKPYLLLAFAYLAGYVAVNITQGCLLLYFKYVIDKESIFTVAMLALVISGALSIPLWKLLIGKYGKRKVSFCAVAITVPAFSMLSVITKDITTPYLIAFAVITGPGCACGFYIPWVLLPDVIDAYTVEFNQRNESIFYGFFVFLSKLAAGCVTGGTMITLKVLDYDATKCDQNESVNMALRVICAACPTFLLLLFGIVMYFFPLNEAKMEENRKYLQRTFFSHTVNVNKDEQNATSTNAVVPCVNNSSFSNTRVRTLSSDFDAQREGSGSIVSSLNRPQDSGGGHPNGARHSSQGSSPVPIQFTSDLQFEYQKSPEGRDSARSLSQVPENESTVEMSNDVNDSMKNTTAVGVLNGKGKTNHVSYEDERKIGRSRSSCSSKSDDKTSPKASRRSPEPGSSKVGPTKPMQSNNTQVVNNTNQFAASNYKFPPARRKDYELLTVRHSLPTIIVAPGDQKSKFHSSMKSHAGSHARKMSYCSNSNTQNSSQTRSAKHKRVMSDFASRA